MLPQYEHCIGKRVHNSSSKLICRRFASANKNEKLTNKMDEMQKELEDCHNELLLLVEKQRAGPVGSIKVFCDIGANAVRSWSHGEM